MKKELFNSNNELFINTIKNHNSCDRHQAVLDVAYDFWQKNRDNWKYSDMIDNAEVMMGQFAKWLILIGKYNQQVTNGGHSQYHYNNYSELHDDLVNLTEKYKDVFTQKTFNILWDCLINTQAIFDTYTNNENSYYSYDFDEDENYEEMNDEVMCYDLDEYDSLYYTIYETAIDEIVDYLNKY